MPVDIQEKTTTPTENERISTQKYPEIKELNYWTLNLVMHMINTGVCSH
jgi:hypothetical protein